jgi:hypothetical protein
MTGTTTDGGGSVDARSRERLAVGRAILDALRHPDFRDEFVPNDPSTGERVIIPALKDDTMGEIFDQLRETPGPAYVVLDGRDGLLIISLLPDSKGRHAAPEPPEPCPIHRHSQIAMLVEYLRHYRQLTIRELAPDVRVELVDDRPDCLASW